jgi:excisionase family DNA binding protein
MVKESNVPNDELLTTKQAANFLGIKENTLSIWRSQKGKDRRYYIPYIRIGRKIRYNKSDLISFLHNQTAC